MKNFKLTFGLSFDETISVAQRKKLAKRKNQFISSIGNAWDEKNHRIEANNVQELAALLCGEIREEDPDIGPLLYAETQDYSIPGVAIREPWVALSDINFRV